jgi:hypothetical protein
MASQQTGRRKNVKWRARVKLDWVEYYIGTFPTKEEAEAAEQDFRERNPAIHRN